MSSVLITLLHLIDYFKDSIMIIINYDLLLIQFSVKHVIMSFPPYDGFPKKIDALLGKLNKTHFINPIFNLD